MHSHKGMISIWFFIGVLLLSYGIIITAASVYEIVIPPVHPVVLQNLHAGVYLGVLLLLIGIVYVTRFRPGRA